jgi:hypothetical protein
LKDLRLLLRLLLRSFRNVSEAEAFLKLLPRRIFGPSPPLAATAFKSAEEKFNQKQK